MKEGGRRGSPCPQGCSVGAECTFLGAQLGGHRRPELHNNEPWVQRAPDVRSEAQEQTLQGGASQGAPRAETPPPGHAGSPLPALGSPVDPDAPLNQDP